MSCSEGANEQVILCIKESVDYSHTFFWVDEEDNPIDLTGCDVYMQVRKGSPNGVLLTDFKEEGFISIGDASEGEIRIDIPAEKTRRPPIYDGEFDILVETPTESHIILSKGKILFERSYTRFSDEL